MKKSTRFLALLLCLVMVATLMPTMALADVGTTVVDDKGVGKDMFKMSKDRYTIMTGDYSNNTDTGYGSETTYLFPKDNGTVEFKITRAANDINRWWRWADDNTVYNQRKTNAEVGYNPAAHNTGNVSTAANGETEDISDWHAYIEWSYSDDGDWFKTKYDSREVTKSGARQDSTYILSKPFLSPQPAVYKWRGGYKDSAETVRVEINTDKKLGTHSILWSANGTSEDQWFAYIEGIPGSADWANGLNEDRYVYYGDLGQNFMYIVEPRYVTYELDGGNMNGDPNNQQYVVWTTGTAGTSQKHKVITAVPEKPGYIFNGWYCEELNKMVTAGTDLNNGITQNMTLVAQWTPNINDPDYMVHFNGNGATSGSMQDQGFKLDMAQNLNLNQFVQNYTINYDGKEGVSERSSEEVLSDFRGWTKVEGQQSYVDYTNGQSVINLASERTEPISTVQLYAQWTPGTVILPDANREATEDEAKNGTLEWMFDGWYYGDEFVGMNGDTYRIPGDGATLVAHWKEIRGGQFYIYHSATGQMEAIDITPYAKVDTYQKPFTDLEGKLRAGDKQYVTSYDGKATFDITDYVTDGYLYGGTFSNEEDAKTGTDNPTIANFNGEKWTVTTEKKWIKGRTDIGTDYDKRIDAVKTETPSSVSGSAKEMHPRLGETYYIHEVSKQHLNPMTVSVWANVDGGYDITHIYLMTAVDRTLYNQVGFTVNGNDIVAANSTDKDVYDKVGITQGGFTTYMTYYQMSRADTTQSSKVVCMEALEVNPNTDVTVVPYWITLDGVKVTGPMQRTFQYIGPGSDDDEYANHRMLKIVEDKNIPSTVKLAPAPVSFNAFLKAAPRLMASQASSVVIQAPDIITVFDAGKEYTIEAVNNSVKGLIQPAGVDGQLFGGWFADEALTAAADLGNVSDGDSVYAKYISGNYLQVKYAAAFTLLNKTISLTAAVDSKDYAETGFVIETKNGTDTVVVNSYATKFALQNAGQLFGVAKNAPLMNVDYKLNGLSRNDKVTITPYWVTADGTTVYGTARTLTFNGLVMKG